MLTSVLFLLCVSRDFTDASHTICAPRGHLLVLINDLNGSVKLCSRFDILSKSRLTLLADGDDYRVYDAGGAGCASGDSGREYGILVVRSDGRTFNLYPSEMKCSSTTYLGRVVLFKCPEDNESIKECGNIEELSKRGNLFFPGEDGCPRVFPARCRFCFHKVLPQIVYSQMRLAEHLELLVETGW